MLDADAIEAINFEQLVTATDRLLLRGSAKRRQAAPRATGADVKAPAFARGSSRVIAAAERPERLEQTVLVRPARGRAQLLAVGVVLPALAGIALGLAALL